MFYRHALAEKGHFLPLKKIVDTAASVFAHSFFDRAFCFCLCYQSVDQNVIQKEFCLIFVSYKIYKHFKYQITLKCQAKLM